MMTAVGGYFNGTQIVPDEDLCLHEGQRVIITVLDLPDADTENLERKMFLAELERKLAHSAQQAANGQVLDGDEALERLSEEFGL